MELKQLHQSFTVCKVEDLSQVDWTQPYLFVGKTHEELSVVCPTASVPANATHGDDGWKGVRIQGVLDFSLVGVLSKLWAVLAENEIGSFPVSTYHTGSILVKGEICHKALTALAAGYRIVS